MKVLIPVDGSKYSLEGAKVAAHYAKAVGAEVRLLTVIPYVSDIDLELSASERDRLLESMKRRGEDVLKKTVHLLKTYGVDGITSVLSTAASPAGEIVSYSEREKIDLIIIGSKGMGASSRFPLGSVTANVVRHSASCVYVVKEPCWTGH